MQEVWVMQGRVGLYRIGFRAWEIRNLGLIKLKLDKTCIQIISEHYG